MEKCWEARVWDLSLGVEFKMISRGTRRMKIWVVLRGIKREVEEDWREVDKQEEYSLQGQHQRAWPQSWSDAWVVKKPSDKVSIRITEQSKVRGHQRAWEAALQKASSMEVDALSYLSWESNGRGSIRGSSGSGAPSLWEDRELQESNGHADDTWRNCCQCFSMIWWHHHGVDIDMVGL